MSPDFVNEHTSSLGESLHGRETYRARLVRFLTDFSGLRYEPEQIIAEGSHVAVPYRMTATWLGVSCSARSPSVCGKAESSSDCSRLTLYFWP